MEFENMLKNIRFKIIRLLISTYLPFLLISIFLLINLLYIWFGNFLIKIENQNNISLITSLLGSAATVFAAITAAVLVLNWKTQHNLSLISRLINDIWDLHGQFTSKIYVLTYTFSIETKESEYKVTYAELIETAVPLRSKTQQLQILLEGQFDEKNWELIQKYLNYLEMFYPWSALEFLEFKDDRYDFHNEFQYAHSALMNVCRKYISLE